MDAYEKIEEMVAKKYGKTITTRKAIGDFMCGRFALAKTSEEITDYFSLKQQFALSPRYNIASREGTAIFIRTNVREVGSP